VRRHGLYTAKGVVYGVYDQALAISLGGLLMEYGIFLQSSHPPGRALADSIDEDVECIEWCDELGLAEAWFGEHLSAAWEPIPACDLVLARAFERTRRISLCAGAYVLPFYHPAALAMRVMQMDHMFRGRFICGIAAGGVPTDQAFFDMDPTSGENRERMQESLAIMMKIWTEGLSGPWRFEGKFWTVDNPQGFAQFGPHLEPFTKPHPRIALAGLSPGSPTLRWAGEQGYVPMSLTFNRQYLRNHWDVYEEGAAVSARPTERRDWRVVRDVFVAETDEEAREWVRSGNLARHWNEMNFPTLRAFDWVQYLKHDPSVPDAEVDVEYLIDNLWMVGSPETVTKKLIEEYETLGGFGTLLVNKYDYEGTEGQYRRSLELLMTEVAPAFAAAGVDTL
jgi:alkanesulfonate monooxygenase SsuD/methylene tetrahydromethanopterin reductase-like flavin-dependent oxidoreductase (luciferase family)